MRLRLPSERIGQCFGRQAVFRKVTGGASVCDANAAGKPMIVLRPFGGVAETPQALVDRTNEHIKWDAREMVDALKRQARLEDRTLRFPAARSGFQAHSLRPGAACAYSRRPPTAYRMLYRRSRMRGYDTLKLPELDRIDTGLLARGLACPRIIRFESS